MDQFLINLPVLLILRQHLPQKSRNPSNKRRKLQQQQYNLPKHPHNILHPLFVPFPFPLPQHKLPNPLRTSPNPPTNVPKPLEHNKPLSPRQLNKQLEKASSLKILADELRFSVHKLNILKGRYYARHLHH